LQGEEWQVGLLASPLERQASLESGQLLLRPWAARNRPFSVFGGALEAVPFARKLFVNSHAYELQCTNEVQGGIAKVRMQFTEQQPKLGELKLAGAYVERVTLDGGPYSVIVDQPKALVKVPVGRYGRTRVILKKGDVEVVPEDQRWGPAHRAAMTISEQAPAVLKAGGPLTNSVSISRRGKNLSLNYKLIGLGGAYQLVSQDRAHPPEFTIFQGDKKVASGKFEFG
jgi:hypothetical protein